MVADIFVRHITKLHDVSINIISDHDPILMSQFWKQLFKLQGTTLTTNSAYHPQTGGHQKFSTAVLKIIFVVLWQTRQRSGSIIYIGLNGIITHHGIQLSRWLILKQFLGILHLHSRIMFKIPPLLLLWKSCFKLDHPFLPLYARIYSMPSSECLIKSTLNVLMFNSILVIGYYSNYNLTANHQFIHANSTS